MDKYNIKLTDIVPAEYNPRRITDDEYDRLSNSILEFGFVDPIIINLKNNRIIGGHQRYNVLLEEYSNENLICIPLGDIGWVFPSDELIIKDDSHEKALNIALNKISGSWDNKKLHDLFLDLEIEDVDLNLTGFQEYEIDKLKYDADVEWAEEIKLENDKQDIDEEVSDEENPKEDYVTCPCCKGEFKLSDVE